MSVREILKDILQSSPLPEPLSPLSDPLTAMSKAPATEDPGDAGLGVSLSWFEQLSDEEDQAPPASEPSAAEVLADSKCM